MAVYGKLTVVDVVRNTSAALSIDGADILLQAGVCDTAGTLGHRAVGVGALRHGSREGRESEDNGGDGELHVDGWVDLLLRVLKVSVMVFMGIDY
jgi:hypothetical protein